jgi:hypothetical protein
MGRDWGFNPGSLLQDRIVCCIIVTTIMRGIAVKFSVVVAAAFGAQLALIWIWSSIYGDASRLIAIIYPPVFEEMTEPLVRHFFGGSDGTLGYYVLGEVLLGAMVYSIAMGILALLFRDPRSENKPTEP